MTDQIDVKKVAEEFRSYAEHFVHEDWNYTRNLGGLTSIRYDYEGDTLRGRVKDAWGWLKGKGDNILRVLRLGDETLLQARLRQASFALKRDKHLPDGVLDSGGIITVWEETGEYLQYVQPSVGSLIADFMESDPHHPSAIAIAEEMERIQEAYAARIKQEQGAEQ